MRNNPLVHPVVQFRFQEQCSLSCRENTGSEPQISCLFPLIIREVTRKMLINRDFQEHFYIFNLHSLSLEP